MIYKNTKNNRGYTLLFAVLVSSTVLSIGISILTISKKEFLLSSSARESTTAFYTADSGIECALYQDDTLGVFSKTAQPSSILPISCMGNSSIPVNVNISGYTSTYNFDVKMQDNGSSACSSVTVAVNTHWKVDSQVPGGFDAQTVVTSKGYNLGWNSTSKTCSDASPRRVERAIVYTY